MLKRGLKNKILLLLSCLFIIFIIYIFPTKDENINHIEKKKNISESFIYLKDQNNYISRVSVYIDEPVLENKIKEIINYLTINSKCSNYIKEGFYPIIPKNTKLLSINIENDLVKLNFSKEFLNIAEQEEEKLLSSLIYSITSIDGINNISIYIDGEILSKMPKSNTNLPPILDRSFGINKVYEFTRVNNTINTTIYYLAKQKDYYYYIPVTVINNDKDEKMEIIINELSSKVSYQTGLISYLKASKDIDYYYDNDTMQISLKKELFNNLNNSDILETVIYSMNLSIKENYKTNKVIYLIDNNFYKTYYI